MPQQAVQSINPAVGNTGSLKLKKQWRWDQIKWVSYKALQLRTSHVGKFYLTPEWPLLLCLSSHAFTFSWNIRAVRAHSAVLGAFLGVMVTADSSGTNRERCLPDPGGHQVKKKRRKSSTQASKFYCWDYEGSTFTHKLKFLRKFSKCEVA